MGETVLLIATMFNIFISTFIVFLFGTDSFQTGVDYFNRRADNSIGLQADMTNIDKALKIFEAELKYPQNLEKVGYYYLACLNFKGQFVFIQESDRKTIYKKAIVEGYKLIKQFPKSAAIRFELITSIGLDAETNGALKSAENGVLNQMLFHTNELIKTDSLYCSCAGWKVLSILHYKTPNIPFFLTWPSKNQAKLLLEKALLHYPSDISNNFYYAELLLEMDNKTEAKKYFQLVTKLPARKEFYLEDEAQKEKAGDYLKKLK